MELATDIISDIFLLTFDPVVEETNFFAARFPLCLNGFPFPLQFYRSWKYLRFSYIPYVPAKALS